MRELKKELWPFRVQVTPPQDDEIEQWLGQNMGAYKGRWNVVYSSNRLDYYFRNGEDSTLFALRWA